MAYSTNPNLPKARAVALRLLLLEAVPLQIVARKCGVHRSTIYRWKLKWLALNSTQQLANFNRPTRKPGRRFRLEYSCRWVIPTNSSRPHGSPHAIAGDIVARVLELRRVLKRAGVAVGRKKRVRPDNRMSPSLVSWLKRILFTM
jgi:transposase-like protein